MANRAIMDVGLQLRDVADGAESSFPADETGLALDLIPQHPDGAEDNSGIDYRFKAVFHNIAATGSPTTVTFSVDVDSLVAFSDTPVEVGSRVWNGTETELEIILDTNDINVLDANAAAIRSSVAVSGGTSPTVTYGCYLTKV